MTRISGTGGTKYAFKVKKIPGGSYYFVTIVLLSITFLPLFFGPLALLDMLSPSIEEPLYPHFSIYLPIDSNGGLGGFLGGAATVAYLLITFIGSIAFINWLLHAWVSIDLRDDRFEITRKNNKRVIHFKDIRDMVNLSKYNAAYAQDRSRTPTIYITLENETYEIRSQHYYFFGTSKQFNAFYKDFKNRLNAFVGGEPLEEEEVRKFTTWGDEIKHLFSAEATEKRKERERKEEERRERIRDAYKKSRAEP